MGTNKREINLTMRKFCDTLDYKPLDDFHNLRNDFDRDDDILYFEAEQDDLKTELKVNEINPETTDELTKLLDALEESLLDLRDNLKAEAAGVKTERCPTADLLKVGRTIPELKISSEIIESRTNTPKQRKKLTSYEKLLFSLFFQWY